MFSRDRSRLAFDFSIPFVFPTSFDGCKLTVITERSPAVIDRLCNRTIASRWLFNEAVFPGNVASEPEHCCVSGNLGRLNDQSHRFPIRRLLSYRTHHVHAHENFYSRPTRSSTFVKTHHFTSIISLSSEPKTRSCRKCHHRFILPNETFSIPCVLNRRFIDASNNFISIVAEIDLWRMIE